MRELLSGMILVLGLAATGPQVTAAQESGDKMDRTVLPIPPAPFWGVIGKTYKESKEAWPRIPAPPEGAPNVIVIRSMMLASVSLLPSAVSFRRRTSTSSRLRGSATIVSTPRRFAVRRALRF
jgi:hypothetical protein